MLTPIPATNKVVYSPSLEILEIVRDRNAQRLRSPEEVLHDRVGVVSEGNLDRSLKAMDLGVLACSLIRLVLLHERNELFRGPALGLEVIVVGGGGTRVHLMEIQV
jgi:hypothetical protein